MEIINLKKKGDIFLSFLFFIKKKKPSPTHTHMGLRSMKKVIESFWVTARENKVNLHSTREEMADQFVMRFSRFSSSHH